MTHPSCASVCQTAFFPLFKKFKQQIIFQTTTVGHFVHLSQENNYISNGLLLFYFFLKRWWYHIFHTCFSYILLHVRPPNIHQLTNDPSRVKVWLHFCCLKCQPWMFFPPLKLSHWKFVFCNFFEKQKTKNKTFWCARIFSTLSALNFWKSTYSENTELVHLG